MWRSPSLTLGVIWAVAALAATVGYWSLPPLVRLHTSPAALELIKEREGLRLDAYKDPGGRLTVGYGHAGPTVTPGMTITLWQAERLFYTDIGRIERYIKRHLTVPITENEFSAMVALAYNIGADAFRRSRVLAAFNEGKRTEAADAFLLWNKIQAGDGGLVVNAHLTKYRDRERTLFLTAVD